MRVVGRTLGLSESRVSQMHSQVLARLREAGGIAT
jgi:DNA-directed RNA polymerase specialized sigma subunit